MFKALRNSVLLVIIAVVAATAATAKAAPAPKMVPVVINGVTVAGYKAAVINGKAYVPIFLLGILRGKTATYDARKSRVVAVGTEQPISRPIATTTSTDKPSPASTKPEAVSSTSTTRSADESRPSGRKPVLEVVMGEPAFKEAVESLELVHRTSVSVPAKLQDYSCVILNNDNAVSPNIAPRLKTFVEKGGGLVMWGETPTRLADTKAGDTMANDAAVDNDSNLKSIVSWFGCTSCYTIQVNQGEYLPASITGTLNRPLGTDLAQDVVLFRHKGDEDYSMLCDPDEKVEIVALWNSDRPDKENMDRRCYIWRSYIAAFVYPYGKGWVYWQSVTDDPNHPKLKELFRAGIWRAATGKNLDSR